MIFVYRCTTKMVKEDKILNFGDNKGKWVDLKGVERDSGGGGGNVITFYLNKTLLK